jgi:hypothetical protein
MRINLRVTAYLLCVALLFTWPAPGSLALPLSSGESPPDLETDFASSGGTLSEEATADGQPDAGDQTDDAESLAELSAAATR